MASKRKTVLALLLACSMAVSLAACGQSEEEQDYDQIIQSTAGKDIERSKGVDTVFSLNSNSSYSMNPFIATYHSNQLICNLVYENMLELDNNFEAIPNIITEWSCSEDAKSWTFKVATGHFFHDGTEVSGKDLRYSLERAITADRFKGRFSSVQGISYTTDTLQVSLGIGDSQFYKLLNIPVVKSGTNGDDRPIGSGPYTYNEDYTALVAYEGYPDYQELPVDTVYIKEYPTSDGTLSAFEDALIDAVVNDPSSYTNLGYASTNEFHNYATTNMHYVAFNEKSDLGKHSYFRVAMQYAFDREYLVQALQGNAVASALPMHPNCADYPQQLADSLKYDLSACKAILENAGIRDYDEDGMLEYVSGSPQEIEIDFVVCSDSSGKGGMAQKFADDMKSIGLNVTVRALTWDNYIKALEDGDFDMYYGEVRLRNNFDLTELLQVRDEDNELTNINYTGSTDTTVEDYINDYLSAGDAGRSIAFQTLCDYITKNTGSLICIGFEEQQLITHRGVAQGVNPNMGNPLYDFANWEITLE